MATKKIEKTDKKETTKKQTAKSAVKEKQSTEDVKTIAEETVIDTPIVKDEVKVEIINEIIEALEEQEPKIDLTQEDIKKHVAKSNKRSYEDLFTTEVTTEQSLKQAMPKPKIVFGEWNGCHIG